MKALLVRHPITGSIVAWVLLLYLTSAYLDIRGDVHTQWWATALVFFMIAYTSGLAWYFSYKKPPANLPLVKLAGFVFAMTLAPHLTAGALVLLGVAAPFCLWVTCAVAGVQFSWYARLMHRRDMADQ